ncbi:MAG: hypothetical protein AAF236_16240, partial [Verrucomicrobiota bacterium]
TDEDRVVGVEVPNDRENPIAVVYTTTDPGGSPFDLDKSLLFRSHSFTNEILEVLSSKVTELRGATAALEIVESTK